MDVLTNALDVLYGLIGLVFVAGAGGMMLMFSFIQITARIAIWLDVHDAFKQRAELTAEVAVLKRTIDTLVAGTDDAERPLIKAIKVNDPSKPGGQRGD